MWELTKHIVDRTNQEPGNKGTIARSPNGKNTIMQKNDQCPEQYLVADPTTRTTLSDHQGPSWRTKCSLAPPSLNLAKSLKPADKIQHI